MEFSVRSNEDVVELFGDGLVFTQQENDNLQELLGNMIYGCALVISTVIHRKTQDPELQKKLANLSVKMLQDILDEHLDEDELSEEGYLYTKMEQMFQEWFDDECSYEDISMLTDDIRRYGVMPCLLYNDDEDTVDACLEPDDEHFFCSFSETIGSIPVGLYKENQATAEATAFAFQLIATVLFDRAFGEEQNPLRADDWVSLDVQLAQFMKELEA